jgi:FkbM family methyltransferase
VDLRRWPPDWRNYQYDRVQLLARRDIGTVLDIGANGGQYGQELRADGFRGEIVSFEPLAEPFGRLQQACAADSKWSGQRAAIGNRRGAVTMNVAANAGASSSLLPMLATHDQAAPGARYVGTEEVQLVTLDDLLDVAWPAGVPLHLKIDVQGYEWPVLAGASRTLQDVVSVEIELSFVPLYAGGLLFNQAMDRLGQLGFALAGILPGWRDPRTDVLLQADGMFVRSG